MAVAGLPCAGRWRLGAWVTLTVASVVATLLMPRWHDVPLYGFWCCLAAVLLLRAVSVRVTSVLVSTGVVLTLVVLVRAAGPGHETLIETWGFPLAALLPMALLPMTLAWYGTRFRRASIEIARLKDQVEATLEHERRFFRNMSHEFRTPLTIARGHLDLAATGLDPGESLADIEIASQELKRLSWVIDRLLDPALVGRNAFLRSERVDPRAVVEAAVRRWTPVYSRSWSVDAGLVGSIDLDTGRIITALDALIENAVAFTDEHDTIAVGGSVVGTDLVLTVRDTGCGIEPDRLDTIFEGYARRAQARSRTAGGTGLGLAIVRTIAEAHGGRVTVESTLGVGTTVSLHLPGFRRSVVSAAGHAVQVA
jgi:signal transduction histidine kinase